MSKRWIREDSRCDERFGVPAVVVCSLLIAWGMPSMASAQDGSVEPESAMCPHHRVDALIANLAGTPDCDLLCQPAGEASDGVSVCRDARVPVECRHEFWIGDGVVMVTARLEPLPHQRGWQRADLSFLQVLDDGPDMAHLVGHGLAGCERIRGDRRSWIGRCDGVWVMGVERGAGATAFHFSAVPPTARSEILKDAIRSYQFNRDSSKRMETLDAE